MTVDLTQTIVPKSNQINADDLIAGPMTIKITKVSLTGAAEQPIAMNFDGDGGKPYLPSKGMRRVLVNTWGTDGASYVGRSMTLYRDDKVIYGGVPVGGIRISHLSHITAPVTMALTATKASRKPFTVQPLIVDEPKAAPEHDKVLDGVEELLDHVRHIPNAQELDILLAHKGVVKKRDYIAQHRPELAARVDEAIASARAAFDPIVSERSITEEELPDVSIVGEERIGAD